MNRQGWGLGISSGVLSVWGLWDKGRGATCFIPSIKHHRSVSRGYMKCTRGPRIQAGVLGGQRCCALRCCQGFGSAGLEEGPLRGQIRSCPVPDTAGSNRDPLQDINEPVSQAGDASWKMLCWRV